jgi:ABC-type transporter Mla maintaining outer membrane lipid asymmetry ATPase subunit MlaF
MSVLELVNFSLGFDERILFENVDFIVQPAETICIETGVLDGASSLLKCCAGIYPPSVGMVLLDGEQLSGLSDAQKFRSVSYCYEHGGLISTFSNYNNIAFPLLYNGVLNKQQIAQRVGELAEALDLTSMLHQEPHLLNDVQTRLMNLLRGLCVRPKLLLLDEIQAGMSEKMINDTIKLIKQQQQETGFGLIISTTAGDLTHFCDRKLIIDNRQLLG